MKIGTDILNSNSTNSTQTEETYYSTEQLKNLEKQFKQRAERENSKYPQYRGHYDNDRWKIAYAKKRLTRRGELIAEKDELILASYVPNDTLGVIIYLPLAKTTLHISGSDVACFKPEDVVFIPTTMIDLLQTAKICPKMIKSNIELYNQAIQDGFIELQNGKTKLTTKGSAFYKTFRKLIK